MLTPAAALAALTRSGDRHGPRADRPVAHKFHDGPLDGRALTLPAPALLADVFVVPWLAENGLEPRRARSGSAFLLRPLGSTEEPTARDTVALAEALRSALAALPADPERAPRSALDDDPYTDVRLFTRLAPDAAVGAYLADVFRSVRLKAPVWSAPREKARPKAPARDPREIAAAHRARRLAQETEHIAEWLALDLTDEDDPDRPRPGQRVRASALWETASAAFEALAEEAEDLGEPAIRPGRNRFLKVADAVLGSRRTLAGYPTFTIPADLDEAAQRAHTIAAHGLAV